jgi:hypothetical protein
MTTTARNNQIISIAFDSCIGESDVVSAEKEAEELAEIFFQNCNWKLYVLLFGKLREKYKNTILELERDLNDVQEELDRMKRTRTCSEPSFTLEIYIGEDLMFERTQVKKGDLANIMQKQLGVILFNKFCSKPLARMDEANFFYNNRHAIVFNGMAVCIEIS